ncbi:peptidylprolyl isomerase [Thermithiobacillus plumbiphilus]|uniref:Chaperone SurA n=1 Tax=Thermithiobacillus plumbiphilus TaxID=1729899 RepID=A0ABU9D9R0_9PROT
MMLKASRQHGLQIGLALLLGCLAAQTGLAADDFVDRNTRIAPAPGSQPVAPAEAAPTQAAPAIQGLQAPVEPLDRVEAVVNTDIITASELNERVAAIAASLSAEGADRLPPENVLRRQVLDRMILDRIQLQLAERSGIRVDDASIDQAIQNIARQNNLSVEQFREELGREGRDYARFRQEIRDRIALARLAQREVESRVTVTADEENTLVKQAGAQWGNSYDLQHLFIALPDNASPAQVSQAQSKAEALRARLERGEDFAKLALAEGDGQDALQGGRLGEKRAGELPPEFVRVFNTMQAGQISPVLRTPIGFHIFKLLDKKEGKPTVPEMAARHILIQAKTPEEFAEAERKIGQIQRQLLQGRDFATLAREYSQDPGSASKGGDLGWVRPGVMVPSFEQALFALKPGEISGPVRSTYGIHLIQAIAQRQQEVPEKDIRQAARSQLQNRKTQERMEQWLREIRAESYVKILDPALQGGAADAA